MWEIDLTELVARIQRPPTGREFPGVAEWRHKTLEDRYWALAILKHGPQRAESYHRESLWLRARGW